MSVALLIVGSLVCAPADALLPMVIGRTLQGFGVGVIPLGISIMGDILPREKLGTAVAVMSSSLGVGGRPVGGRPRASTDAATEVPVVEPTLATDCEVAPV